MQYFLFISALLLQASTLASAFHLSTSNETESSMLNAAKNYLRSLELSRIQNGHAAGTEPHKYIVEILLWDPIKEYVHCSGVLIHRSWAITSARCFRFNPQNVYVYYAKGPKTGDYYVEATSWTFSNGYTLADLVLVRFPNIGWIGDDWIATLAHPDRDPYDNYMRALESPGVYIAGYGSTQGNGFQQHMMIGAMMVEGSCWKMKTNNLIDWMDVSPREEQRHRKNIICLQGIPGNKGLFQNVCEYDSGGPIMLNDVNLNFIVIGIMSFDVGTGSNGCDSNQLTRKKGKKRYVGNSLGQFAYGTRISAHYEWIKNTLEKDHDELKTNEHDEL